MSPGKMRIVRERADSKLVVRAIPVTVASRDGLRYCRQHSRHDEGA